MPVRDKDQAWVTWVTNDQDAVNAIRLATSLKKVLTTRRLVVLVVAEQLTSRMRNILELHFHFVYDVSLSNNGTQTLPKQYEAVARCWRLTLLEKCIFIDSDSLVLKYCDNFFEKSAFSTISVVDKNVCKSALVVIQPQVGKYTSFKKFYYEFQTNGHGPTLTDVINGFAKSIGHNDNDVKSDNKQQPENITTDAIIKQENHAFKTNDILKIEHELSLNSLENPYPTFDPANEPIAIIGVACRFPAGNNSPDTFWTSLIEGKDCMIPVPENRHWDKKYLDKPVLAGFLDVPVDEFDAKFFGISGRQAPLVDPQQRFLLEVSWEAMENAGINPLSLNDTNAGIFMGFWNQDYQRLLQEHISEECVKEFHRVYLGNAISASSARLSYFLGANGPNIAAESGCSSAMLSLHHACENLRSGRCNVALAGGVSLILCPFTPHHEGAQHVLAPDCHCKTFDAKADGFARGEACCVIVVKRASDAIRDGDNILGLVRSTACNQEGTSQSFGTPSQHVQETVIRDSLKLAEVSPLDVDVVEAHGTGTVVGDPIEVAAIGAVYGGKRDSPLCIGSVKTNVGHTEAVAGFAGLVKMLMAFKHEQIPPHVNFESLNPNINLEAISAEIPTKPVPWPRSNRKRLCGISSFGMSGTNVHVIVEEPPNLNVQSDPDQLLPSPENHILTVSAKSEEALEAFLVKYQNFLENDSSDISFDDICFTANTTRAQLSHRFAVVGKDKGQILRRLEKRNGHLGKHGQLDKVAFIFTGQGSQYTGMAKNLYETNSVFRSALNECDNLLKNNMKISLFDVMWNETGNGSQNLLNQTLYSQTAIYCVEYALLKLWTSLGFKPDCVFGHSVGEFAAAVAAGILKFEDALKLVSERARLIHQLPSGGMLVVKSSESFVKDLISSSNINWLDIAVVNSNDEIVVAGRPEALDMFQEHCQSKNINCQRLAACQAFHSRDMNLILDEYEKIANTVDSMEPVCPFVSGSTGRLMTKKEDFNTKYWVSHARDAVHFPSALKTLYEESGCRTFIEIGPQPILSALTVNNLVSIGVPTNDVTCLPSIRKTEGEWTTLLGSLGKLFTQGWNPDFSCLYDSMPNVRKTQLPNYPFQRQKYWFTSMDSDRDMTFSSGKGLHPLLGHPIPLRSDSYYFQNTLRLSSLKYLEDHVVVDKIILPGAGFLEMILVAGYAALMGSHDTLPELPSAIAVSDFSIHAPMELEQGKPLRLQTIVNHHNSNTGGLESNDDYNGQNPASLFDITVFQGFKDMDGHSWDKHASGKFATSPLRPDTFDVEDLRSLCTEEFPSEEFYKKGSEMGISLKGGFQSIEKVWRGDANECMFAELAFSESPEGYVCHPIILDAMIQVLGVKQVSNQPGLYLPTGVKSLLIFPHDKPTKLFAYLQTDKSSSEESVKVSLLNEQGEELARMEGVEMMQTSKAAISTILRMNQRELPQTFVEVHRSSPGILCDRADLMDPSMLQIEAPSPNLNEYVQHVRDALKKTEKEWKGCTELCLAVMLHSFYECGCKFDTFENRITTSKVLESGSIAPSFENFISLCLYHMEKAGVFHRSRISDSRNDDSEEYIIDASKLPSPEKVKSIISNATNSEFTIELKFLQNFSKKLPLILQKKISPLQVLLAEDNLETHASIVYTDFRKTKDTNLAVQKCLEDVFATFPSNKTVRILEVGAGTGATTKYILSCLEASKLNYIYYFTDISKHFLQEGAKMFKDVKRMHFKTFNLEKDPKEQAYAPGCVDIVVGANVMHATKRIRESVRVVRHLLAPGGYACFFEMFSPNIDIDLIFGTVDGYWSFADFDLRKHPMLSMETWERVMLECGFESAKCVDVSNDNWGGLVMAKAARDTPALSLTFVDVSKKNEETEKNTWLVFGHDDAFTQSLLEEFKKSFVEVTLVKHGLQPRSSDGLCVPDPSNEQDFIDLFNTLTQSQRKISGIVYLWGLETASDAVTDQMSIVGWFMQLSKAIVSNKVKINAICVVTRGTSACGLDEVISNPHASTLHGFGRSFIMETTRRIFCMDLQSEGNLKQEVTELFSELWCNDGEEFEYLVRYRNGRRYKSRINLTQQKKMAVALHLPKSGRYQLILPESQAISDLQFGPCPMTTLLEQDDVEVEVRSAALNFRDLFIIMKPEGYWTDYENVGCEFSGVVTTVGSKVTKFKSGDCVFGIATKSAIASHTVTKEAALRLIPPHFTFSDAVTLPVGAGTVALGLNEIANLKAGETILIHAASGGVGLVAIQFAKKVGANIIVTAGSQRKQTFLRNLGIAHVFHSRSTKYLEDVMRVTDGRGVDVVLNSLTGPGFKEATLDACAVGARFVEMSRVNTWTVEEVADRRPDVTYTIINLETKLEAMQNGTNDDVDSIISSADKFKSLPHTRFDVTQIKEALDYFAKAQHIGKIVVTMPTISYNSGRLAIKDREFEENATYLVTGGLAGIGLEVAKWMANSGAKTLVLVGRSAPSEETLGQLKTLGQNGTQILHFQVDVGDRTQIRQLFSEMRKLELPELRGIMHCAGCLSDATLSNQTWEKFQTVFKSKVNGTMILHEETLDYRLNFFVLFSSIASIFGNLGQSNHSAANCFLDTFAHYRHSLGLPVQSINWGIWGEVGVASKMTLGKEGALGIRPFSAKKGVASLKAIMRGHAVQSGVWEIDVTVLKASLPPYLHNYLSEMHAEKTAISSMAALTEEECKKFWTDFKAAPDFERKKVVVKNLMEDSLRIILKLSHDEKIDENQNFSEMGMDSLMAVELRNRLQGIIGTRVTLNTTALMEHPNLASLSQYMTEQMDAADLSDIYDKDEEGKCDQEDDTAMHNLLVEDSTLPDSVLQMCQNISKQKQTLKCILLTGATGNLGSNLAIEMLQSLDSSVQIFCLVRAKSLEKGMFRLQERIRKLNVYGDIKSLDLTRLKCVIGDITQSKLGMDETIYDSLAQQVDTVVHLACKVNLIEKYNSSLHNKFSIRSVNIQGTKNILEFSVAGQKVKRVFYPQSWASVSEYDEEGYSKEEFPQEDNFGNISSDLGLNLSKFICEKLLCQAVKLGIPCTVMRLPPLSGHSVTGKYTAEKSLLMAWWLTSIKMKMMPKVENALEILPVDILSRIILRYLQNEDDTMIGVYNLVKPTTSVVDDCLKLAHELGFDDITLVEPEEFQKSIQAKEDSILMGIFKNAISNDIFPDSFRKTYQKGKSIWRDRSKLSMQMSDLYETIPDFMDHLRAMHAYSVKHRIYTAFGIQ